MITRESYWPNATCSISAADKQISLLFWLMWAGYAIGPMAAPKIVTTIRLIYLTNVFGVWLALDTLDEGVSGWSSDCEEMP